MRRQPRYTSRPDQRVLVLFLAVPLGLFVVDLFPAHFHPLLPLPPSFSFPPTPFRCAPCQMVHDLGEGFENTGVLDMLGADRGGWADEGWRAYNSSQPQAATRDESFAHVLEAASCEMR